MLERLQVWSDDNKYYKQNGLFNTFSDDVQMPNCTAFAFLRAQELMEADTKKSDIIRLSGGFGNAKTWYDTSPSPKGSELRAGSIGVCDGEYGHVFIVERVIDGNHALISESFYADDKSLRNYQYFHTRIVELEVNKATLQGVGVLKGFIYLPINDLSKNARIEITEDFVNCRFLPDGEIYSKGLYLSKGKYQVLSVKKVNGYNWYQIDTNKWVREGSWLTVLEETKEQKINNLAKQIVELSM